MVECLLLNFLAGVCLFKTFSVAEVWRNSGRHIEEDKFTLLADFQINQHLLFGRFVIDGERSQVVNLVFTLL